MRIIEERIIESNMRYIEAAGLSTETKPTANIITGSLYMESDTGDVYIFSETDVTWTKIGC